MKLDIFYTHRDATVVLFSDTFVLTAVTNDKTSTVGGTLSGVFYL